VEHVARMGAVRGACNICVGKPEEKKPLGKRRRIWEDNIKMDRMEIRWVVVDRTHLAENRNQ